MSPHQHRIRIRIPIHRHLQARRQVLLVRGVFDDRHGELVEVSEHAPLAPAAGDTFDLLDLLNLEAGIRELRAVRRGVPLYQQRDQDGPLRVRTTMHVSSGPL